VTDKEIFWEKSTNMISWQEAIPVEIQQQRADEAAFRHYRVELNTFGENVMFFRMGVRAVSGMTAK